jgi:hypothetical protein
MSFTSDFPSEAGSRGSFITENGGVGIDSEGSDELKNSDINFCASRVYQPFCLSLAIVPASLRDIERG